MEQNKMRKLMDRRRRGRKPQMKLKMDVTEMLKMLDMILLKNLQQLMMLLKRRRQLRRKKLINQKSSWPRTSLRGCQ